MNLDNIGLVLEGGGLRGVYTTGVLDFFLDKEMVFPYVIGVSAGACHAFSYISGQKGRSYQVTAEFINDHRYLSFRNFIRYGGIFGMDFIFDEIPLKLNPFDYEAFENTNQNFVVAVTNCITGEAEYFSNKDGIDMFLACRASSSLPMVSKPVMINGIPYFDGGMADSIPIKRAISDGYEKNIVILTRNKGYRKKTAKKSAAVMKHMYKKFPFLVETYKKRAEVYNETLDYIEELEKQGKVFVIRPCKPLTVSRMEKDVKKLKSLYEEGLEEGALNYKRLTEWISSR